MSGFTLNKKADSEFGSAYSYFMLLKPRVMSLAIFTALVGQILASQQNYNNPILTFISLFSIALGAGAAGCINMWYERDIDALMQRTKNRPIPKGLIKAIRSTCIRNYFINFIYYVANIIFKYLCWFFISFFNIILHLYLYYLAKEKNLSKYSYRRCCRSIASTNRLGISF